ncbi:MAG: SufD family Fe-S cluster assembly protein [Bacilli bacterium]|nr:SufD family Fe-S cluster assembly protein [Bacilli bacterium]
MNISLVDKEIKDMELTVKAGDSLVLNLAAFDTFPTAKIRILVEKDGHVNASFADFSRGKGKFVIDVELLEEGAECNWNLSSLARENDDKVVDASVLHVAKHTTAEMNNYGITRDQSRLVFTGVSRINNGAKSSSTRQSAKIIVFDPNSDGRCSPSLCIDENDVQASHAAIVGRLNENHLFYLQSRGISEENAKRLITLGYLKPIEQYFKDEDLLKRIDNAIEEGI